MINLCVCSLLAAQIYSTSILQVASSQRRGSFGTLSLLRSCVSRVVGAARIYSTLTFQICGQVSDRGPSNIELVCVVAELPEFAAYQPSEFAGRSATSVLRMRWAAVVADCPHLQHINLRSCEQSATKTLRTSSFVVVVCFAGCPDLLHI